MIIITSTAKIKAQHFKDAVALAKTHVASSRLEEGCLSHQYFEDPENERNLVFLECWRDQEAINFHFTQSYSQTMSASFKAWSDGPLSLEFHHVEKTDRLSL